MPKPHVASIGGLPASKDWNRIRFHLPPTIPAMISAEERRYLYWLASENWKCEGHIVEVGPWLGGSTYCLAEGMRDNSVEGTHKLHVFDNFVWREFMRGRTEDNFEDLGAEDIQIARYAIA